MAHRGNSKNRYKKFLFVVLPGVLVLVVGLAVFFGAGTYRLTHPPPMPETVNPSQYLLSSVDVSWTARDGFEFSAWWLPGTKGAPGILLAPGYGMNRSLALSLASMLKGSGFNLLVYQQRGSGAAPKGISSLGLRETEDMLAALDFMQGRPELDRAHLGIWGVDIGARAALKCATIRPEVRAIAADSAFEKVT